MLPAALIELSDWTTKTRTRAANILIGTLWCAGPAATDHLESLLAAFAKTMDDADDAVQRQVRRCACILGGACELRVYLPMVLTQLDAVAEEEGMDASVVGRRALWLSLLGALTAGACAHNVEPHLGSLLAAVARPTFCVPSVAADEERTAAYSDAQSRLARFLETLIDRAGAPCCTPPHGLLLYSALMRIASVPSSAANGFASQRRAVETLAKMAVAAGVSDGLADGGVALHEVYMPELLRQVLANGAFKQWKADSADWHLTQTLLRQCDGGAAASVLVDIVPMLATLLDPKREPTLRLTVLSVLDHLLSTHTFAVSTELADWAEDIFGAMLLPNLVWRAGKAAEHVRLASALCLSKLVPLPHLSGAVLSAHLDDALPLFTSILDDDNSETRRLSCDIFASALPRLTAAALTSDTVRKLYPEMLKRLDDASDAIRLKVCTAILALVGCFSYSAIYASSSNLDKTNYQYFLRGLLVHLDDPSPQIQHAVSHVIAEALQVDPPICVEELRAVRDRQRSPALCDELMSRAQGAGQLV